MADRRQTKRPGSVDRRKPEQQFGRGTGLFAETVNRTFAIIREIETRKNSEPEPEAA